MENKIVAVDCCECGKSVEINKKKYHCQSCFDILTQNKKQFIAGVENFICYLIDKYEREVITEENLHLFLYNFLKDKQYNNPEPPKEVE